MAAAKRMLVMAKKYNKQDCRVVEADFSSEGVGRVLQRIKHLCGIYLPENMDALETLLKPENISRVYTFLPSDMPFALRRIVLDHEHCTWGAEYFLQTLACDFPNVTYVPMTWRHVSQERLQSKIHDFIDEDAERICILGAYDHEVIRKAYASDCKASKIGNLLRVDRCMFDGFMPVVLDSQILDTFGFLSTMFGWVAGKKDVGEERFSQEHADVLIRASAHIFMEVHEGENICVIDINTNRRD